MSGVNLMTVANSWTKLASSNFATTFGTLKSTLTEPTGSNVIKTLNSGAGAAIQNAILLRFFGTNASDNTGKVRVWGWSKESSTGSWENVLLAEFAITLGNIQGTANCAITANDFEADTITLTYGNDDVDVSINSPANNVRGAYAQVDIKGSQKVQIEFDINSSATDLNCLYKLL